MAIFLLLLSLGVWVPNFVLLGLWDPEQRTFIGAYCYALVISELVFSRAHKRSSDGSWLRYLGLQCIQGFQLHSHRVILYQ